MIDLRKRPSQKSDEQKDDLMSKMFINGIRGMILVAFADGHIHWKQKVLLMESIRIIGTHVTAEEGLNLLENIATTLGIRGDLPGTFYAALFKSARELPKTEKRIILGMSIKMGFQDWKLSVVETKMIIDIADWIDIDSASRGRVVDEVLQAMGSESNEKIQYSGLENLENIRG